VRLQNCGGPLLGRTFLAQLIFLMAKTVPMKKADAQSSDGPLQWL